MASNRIFHSVLLASGVLLIAACATKPAGSLEEKYFQQEARNYQKFEKDGQTIYCLSEDATASLIPLKHCITEDALRQRVENYRRNRNTVPPPTVAGPGQGDRKSVV